MTSRKRVVQLDSKFGNLQYLVLPAGATTGQRIELDGITGEIRIYNSSNQLVGRIDAAGVFTSFEPAGTSKAVVAAAPTVGQRASLELYQPDFPAHTKSPTSLDCIDGADIGYANHPPLLAMVSPEYDSKGFSQLDLFGSDQTNSIPQLLLHAVRSGSQIPVLFIVDGYQQMSRYGCRVRRVANQSVNSGVGTPIQWDTQDSDSDGFIAPPSATITIPNIAGMPLWGEAGVFAITAFLSAPTVANTLLIGLTPTSSYHPVSTYWQVADPVVAKQGAVTWVIPLDSTDSFQINARHTTGVAVNFTGNLNCWRVATTRNAF